jgi:hypothetical protein
MEFEAWAANNDRYKELVRQTEQMEWKMQMAGGETRRPDALRVVLKSIATSQEHEVTPWRNINFLPAVAARNRGGQLKSFEFFAQDRPYLRYSVCTIGARCSIELLKGQIQKLHRAVSNLAADPRMRQEWQADVVLRVTEITVERTECGALSFHPHANVCVETKKFLTEEQWDQFLALVRTYLDGAHWEECGQIKNIRELIKYPVKPADLECMTGEELLQLAAIFHRLKIYSPMGEFRAMRKEHKQARVRPVKRKAGNRTIWAVQKMPPVGRKSEQETPGGASEITNHIVTVTTPQARFSPVMEPCVLVINPTKSTGEIMDNAGYGELRETVQELWFQKQHQLPEPENWIEAPEVRIQSEEMIKAIEQLERNIEETEKAVGLSWVEVGPQGGEAAPIGFTLARQLPGRTYKLDPAKEHPQKFQTHFGRHRLVSLSEELYPEFAKKERERKKLEREEHRTYAEKRRSAFSKGKDSEKKA